MRWSSRVEIKHLLTDDDDLESVQASMNAIADVLEESGLFLGFGTGKFRSIPAGDDVFLPSDYANRLLDGMYDYADDNGIWIA